MRTLLLKLRGLVDLRDAFVFTGLALVGYGLYAIYPPVAFVVVGTALFWMGAH
jgi:hypothetical protein